MPSQTETTVVPWFAVDASGVQAGISSGAMACLFASVFAPLFGSRIANSMLRNAGMGWDQAAQIAGESALLVMVLWWGALVAHLVVTARRKHRDFEAKVFDASGMRLVGGVSALPVADWNYSTSVLLTDGTTPARYNVNVTGGQAVFRRVTG